MTTLREAAQMALEALEYAEQNHGGDDCYFDAIKALRAALAQPKQDPVAWWHDRGDVVDLNVSGHGTPLYFAPPQRSWQGLTQEEVRRIVQSNTDPWCDTPETDGYGVAEMVESKLREKNGNF